MKAPRPASWMIPATVAWLFCTDAGAFAAPPVASPWSSCTLRHPANRYDGLSALPEEVRKAFEHDVGDLAGVSQDWNGGDADVIVEGRPADTRPRRKLLQVVQSGNRWFVWYLHGGQGVHVHVAFYASGLVDGDGKPGALSLGNLTGTSPCAATDAFLDGVSPALPGDR